VDASPRPEGLYDLLAALVAKEKSSGRLTVTADLLGPPDAGIKALLDTYNDGQPLIVHDAVLAEPGKDSSVALVTGTMSYRNVDAAPVAASFYEVGEALELRIRLALPSTWRFSQSFPKLPTSIDFRAPLLSAPSPLLDLLVLSDAAFVLSTHDHVDDVLGAQLPAGLDFVARLDLVGLLGAIAQTLGGADQQLVIAGPILLPPPVPTVVPPPIQPAVPIPSPTPLPGINLSAKLHVDAALGPISLRDTALRIYCPPDDTWLALHPERPPAIFFGGTLAIDRFALDVWAQVPPGGGDFLVLTAQPEGGLGGFDLGALSGLIGQDDLAGQLTPQLGDLGEISLHTLTFALSVSPPELHYASLTVGLDGMRWAPFGDVLQITDLESIFTVTSPLASDRSLAVLLVGTFTIQGIDVTVVIDLPDFTVTAEARNLPALPLSSLMRTYLPAVPPVADLTVQSLQVAARPGQVFALSVRLAAQPGAWTLQLGPQTLTVQDVGLVMEYAAGAGFTGAFSGRLGVAGVDLQLGYQVPGPFALRADLPDIGLRALLEALCDQQIPWPPGFDVVLKRSRVQISGRGTDLALILGTQLDGFGSLALEVRRVGEHWGFAAGFALPTGWRLAQLSPDLAALDTAFQLRRMILAVASFDDPGFTFPDLSTFGDPSITTPQISLPASAPGVKAGINMFAELVFGGDRGLELIKNSLRLDRATVDVLLQIGENPANALLSAGLSGSFNENIAFVGALRIQLVDGSPAIGLLGQVSMQANGQPLVFTAQLNVGPNGAVLAGTMAGTWTGAFGIPALTLADVALALGISWELVPAIGIAATVSLGEIAGSAAVLFDGTMPSRSLLAGSLSDLGMTDVVRTLIGDQVAIPPDLAPVLDGIRLEGVPLFDIPGVLAADLDGATLAPAVITAFLDAGRISLPATAAGVLLTVAEPGQRWYLTDRMTLKHYGIARNQDVLTVSMQVQLYVAPQPTLIGQLMFPQGVRLSATASAFGLGGSVDLDVDPSAGISLGGSIQPIDAGPIFSLTGHAGDNGPQVSMATYDAPASRIRGPHFVVSGAVTMLGFTRDIDLRASRDGFSLTVSAVLFNVFAAEVTATCPLSHFDASDLVVSATMDNDLLTLLRTRGVDAIQRAVDDANRSISDARTQVATAQGRVTAIQGQIDAQVAQIRRERSSADDAVRNAQDTVNSIQNQIHGEQREINRLNARIDRLKSQASIRNGWNAIDIIARGAELAKHEITMRGEQAAWHTALGVLQGASAAVTSTPIELDPRVSGLYTELGLATAGLNGAQAVLDQTWAALGSLASVGEWIANNGAGNLLDITHASFEGRLGVVSGGAVSLQVAYTLLGQPGTTSVDFNFHDVERGVSALTDLLKQQASASASRG
jgi:hypothetical protein